VSTHISRRAGLAVDFAGLAVDFGGLFNYNAVVVDAGDTTNK
jgi:hypothetical protein